MADFNEYSQKGSTLMQQALKKLAEGDFEGFEKDREVANRYFDLLYQSVNSEDGKMTQMYGESRNFGIIFNIIEQNMNKLLETKKGKEFIKKAYKMIKGNNVLNEQFKVYDFFEKANYVENSKEFVNETLSIIKTIDKKQIKENNEKLIKLIRDYKLDEMVEIPEETENLYEAIEYVLLNEKKLENVNKFINATNVITEHIQNAQRNTNVEDDKTFNSFKDKIEAEESKINENINEDEKKLLDTFMSSKTNKKQIFENYKKQTLEKINDTILTSENEDKESWQKIYESVKSKNYSDKMTENIVNCAEMLEICNTIEE